MVRPKLTKPKILHENIVSMAKKIYHTEPAADFMQSFLSQMIPSEKLIIIGFENFNENWNSLI